MTDDAPAGTYTLLLSLLEPVTVEVGALGERTLPAGHCAYTGSALGPGGFARVDRHREVAAGERAVRQWHVDYLLGHPDSGVAAAIRSPAVDAECVVANGVEGDRVAGVGASDCDCGSHLVHGTDRATLYESAWDAHRAAADPSPVDGPAGGE